MQNLNKLCHSLGSLEAQICALNDNIRDLRGSILSISKRVSALEKKYAFWSGKVFGVIGVISVLAYGVNILINFQKGA